MTASTPTLSELPFIDIQSERYRTAPHDVLAEVRREGDLARSGRGIEVLRYDWVAEALVDERFEEPSNQVLMDACPGPYSRAMVEDGVLPLLDPAKHMRLRRVFMRAFTIRKLHSIGEMVDSVAARLVDSVLAAGRCDVPVDVSSRLTMEVLCRHIGIPVGDIESFVGTSEKIQRNLMELVLGEHAGDEALVEFESASEGLHAYVHDLLQRRIAEPQDDFVSALVQAQDEAGRLSPAELVWGIVNLVPAGHQTTANQISLTVDAVLAVPGEWERLAADPSSIDRAVAESMRLHPVVGSLARVAGEDLDLHGLPVPAGSRINLNVLAAGRDPKAFPDPDRYDPDRPSAGFEVPFGRGRHHCLGHWLATAEIHGTLRCLTSRLTDVAVDGEIVREPYSITGGITSLPIRFRAR